MRVAGYIRVSTEQQKEEGSHERQREKLEEWADRNDHELDIYQDIAISGQSDDRPDYDEMISRVDEYDAVAVRELSRFGRSLSQVLDDIETLQDSGVEFVSVTENFDTSDAMGKAMMQMIGVFNEFWANLARERALEEAERRREEGLPMGRPKKLDDEQREEVFKWRRKGMPYGTIAMLIGEMYGVDVDRSTIYRYCKDEGVEPEVAD